MTKKSICAEAQCTGCSACLNVCSKNAISMVADELGFSYPQINADKCVDCGLCSNVCPVNHPRQQVFPMECYAATAVVEPERARSASGGVATILSRCVLRNNGVVYGCCGEDVFHVTHIRIDRNEDVCKLQGSKYVQSDVGSTFRSVQKDLKDGRQVLYIGTPCQIAGLKSFLRKGYDGLVTVDLVCHGTPSQKMLSDNIHSYISQTSKHVKLAFRKKTEKGIRYGLFLQTDDINVEKCFDEDPYLFAFLNCLNFRRSCYMCRYSTAARVSDITLGDFWGLSADAGLLMHNAQGVNVCLINTERGGQLFDEIKSKLRFAQRNPMEAIIGNGQLQVPSRIHVKRDSFQALYPKVGLQKAVDLCLRKEKIEIRYIKPIKNSLKRLIGKRR